VQALDSDNSVRGVNDLVVLPTFAVAVLPTPVFMGRNPVPV
jgi:hypothetical protein